jgi:hypothetical protein
MFAPCIVLFGQSSWDGPVPFRQSPTQGGSIQSNCEEISALLLDKLICDQHQSPGTVVSQMNPVHGLIFYLNSILILLCPIILGFMQVVMF